MIERVARWLDRRIGGPSFAEDKLSKVFPESWTFLFGEIALYAFVVLVLTGIFLALFYNGSITETTYHGSYDPLVGQRMSAAYESAIRLSFDVRAGLLMRQTHHWAALVFTGAIVVHLMRVFFTGAFRKPRDINWMVGVTLLISAIIEGFIGYSLLDDILSGIGLRIGYSILESIPVIGSWIASAVFGGQFPGNEIFGRLLTLHIFILPALMTGLIAVHLALVFRQVHTQHRGVGRREDNVVGVRMWPTYAAMSGGLFCLVAGILFAMGGLVQINPVWLYGPYDPFLVTVGAQPDWYMGWLEGALRLFPPWELTVGDYMVPNPFFPTILLPAVVFGTMYAWPAIERRLTGDTAEHHLLDRPRDRPVRTAFGTAALSFFLILFVAGSQDIIAFQLNVGITGLVWFLRGAVLAVPPLVFLLTYRIVNDLRASSHEATGVHAHEELEQDDDPDGDGDEDRGEDTAGGVPRWTGLLAALGARLLGRGERA